jgi:hypothetical protein
LGNAAPELRKNLVYELIRRDIFKIYETDRYDFVLEILNIKNKALRHAMTSLISVLSSTLKGVEYLSHNNNDCILQRIIKVSRCKLRFSKSRSTATSLRGFVWLFYKRAVLRKA